MAKGMKCQCCGHHCYAQREDHQEKGTWVTYVCRNNACKRCGRGGKEAKCTWTTKIFEENKRRW